MSQCDVARRPRSRPAAARIAEPEHTDVVQVDDSWARRSQSGSFPSRACSIDVMPPGTRMMSGEGVSSKECVAPISSTPESAGIGPGSCQTKRTSASGRASPTSWVNTRVKCRGLIAARRASAGMLCAPEGSDSIASCTSRMGARLARGVHTGAANCVCPPGLRRYMTR